MPAILVVDDEETIRDVFRHALEPIGYAVSSAADGAEALALIHHTPFDVIVVDLRMPGMSGQEFLRAFERTQVLVPLIVMSGYGDMDAVIDVMRHGAIDFLQKPFAPADVIAALDRALTKPRQTPVKEAARAHDQRGASADAAEVAPTRRADAASPGDDSAAATSDPTSIGNTDPLFRIRTQLEDGSLQLPVMGPVFEAMIQLTNKPLASSDEVLELVGREPAIASAILKMANSAFFGGLEPVRSLKEAVVRLGNKAVLNLASTVLLGDFFAISGHVYQSLLLQMWKNTLGSAHAARLVAAQATRIDPDRVYMAALFHNIGEPLLVRISSEIHPADELDDESLNVLAANVRKHHGTFGGMLLRAWKSDQQLIALTMHHHEPARFIAEQRQSRDARDLINAVTIGHELALEAGYTYLGKRGRAQDLTAIARLAGISRQEIDEFKAVVRQAVEGIA